MGNYKINILVFKVIVMRIYEYNQEGIYKYFSNET